MVIGKHLRDLREKQGLLLRQVAASLEVDTAYISKMERGEKNIKREFIVKLAEIYKVNLDDLLAIWLADQIFDLVKSEEVALKALTIAENDVKTFISDKKMKKK